MTILSLPVKSIRSHEEYLTDLAREWGVAEGRALMALEHGIADEELMLFNATYYGTVTAFFRYLAYGSPLAIVAKGMRHG